MLQVGCCRLEIASDGGEPRPRTNLPKSKSELRASNGAPGVESDVSDESDSVVKSDVGAGKDIRDHSSRLVNNSMF